MARNDLRVASTGRARCPHRAAPRGGQNFTRWCIPHPGALRTATPYLSLALLFLALMGCVAHAQNSTTCTTNFYNVTGSTFREIRASIAKARPWKDRFDGDTRWDVRWKFQYAERPGGCAITSYSVSTKIVITLPRWTPPADVDSAVKEQWSRFYTALAQHELGHARLGTAAGEEVGQKIKGTAPQAECAALRKMADEQAEQAVADYRAREKDYDRRTNHGANPSGVP